MKMAFHIVLTIAHAANGMAPKNGSAVTVSALPSQDAARRRRDTIGSVKVRDRVGMYRSGLEGDPPQCGVGEEGRRFVTYTVIYEQGPTSWGAYVPDLPGVITVGESRDEVERLIQEAIEFHIEGLRDEGLPAPAPSSFAGVVDVDSAV
jgi:predicted RNase H-like HicB family nuclease